MITYMYTFTYDEQLQISGCEEHKTSNDESEGFKYDDPGAQDGHVSREKAISSSSVRTYAIAEKYGIPSLKTLAQDKFGAWLEVNWFSDHCPTVIQEAFETTPMEEKGLRDVVARVLARNVRGIVDKPTWQPVLAQHGQLTLLILSQYSLPQLGMQFKLTTDISQLQSQVSSLTQTKSQEAQARSTVTQNLQALRDLLQKNDKCRHCHVPFNAYVEAKDPPVLRCSVCQTKHR